MAYVAGVANGNIDGPGSVQVIDVSDPVNPAILGSVDTPGRAYGVAVADGVAYVADEASGLQVIDVSAFDPSGGCEADVSDDGAVGFEDLTAMLSKWGPCDACPADISGDGDVGFPDLTTLLSAWGPC